MNEDLNAIQNSLQEIYETIGKSGKYLGQASGIFEMLLKDPKFYEVDPVLVLMVKSWCITVAKWLQESEKKCL
jgi:hypothetical protein